MLIYLNLAQILKKAPPKRDCKLQKRIPYRKLNHPSSLVFNGHGTVSSRKRDGSHYLLLSSKG
jgi:hypothetical protein